MRRTRNVENPTLADTPRLLSYKFGRRKERRARNARRLRDVPIRCVGNELGANRAYRHGWRRSMTRSAAATVEVSSVARRRDRHVNRILWRRHGHGFVNDSAASVGVANHSDRLEAQQRTEQRFIARTPQAPQGDETHEGSTASDRERDPPHADNIQRVRYRRFFDVLHSTPCVSYGKPIGCSAGALSGTHVIRRVQ